ncbi:MAG: membrane-bound lytic murein transglycosylase MltF [Pseudomonadota bacterium]|nr:membrane-bound lytic murein transglycosylase MltF [Pseudomonadota bacterium]
MDRQLKAHCLVVVMFLLTIVVRLAESEPRPTLLDNIRSADKLGVVMLADPSGFADPPRGVHGFEFDLVHAFARDLGVELEVVAVDDPSAALEWVARGDTHFAAGGLSPNAMFASSIRFGPAYFEFTPQLVYRTGDVAPLSLEDLDAAAVAVGNYPAWSDIPGKLLARYPKLEWRKTGGDSVFEQVWSGSAKYAVAGSHDVLYSRRFFPGLRVAFDISEPSPLAWAFPRTIDDSIYQAASAFLETASKDGSMQILIDRHFDHAQGFGDANSLTFLQRLEERLPRHRPLFESVAESTGMDWRLLAAMAYQESHWDPEATSPTGVRGLMMLTRAAANDLGIADRLDPEKSVHGGAEYFLLTRHRIPPGVSEPDRTWMALAAYNVGIGHLGDARRITQLLGGNPDLWRDVRKYLPLLSEPDVYRRTRYGFARGAEPVNYVRNIRNYLDILLWKTRPTSGMVFTNPIETLDFGTVDARIDEPSLLPLGS